MKRIIQCPKCEAKLSVLDIGKPISQKCPKCGNSINLDSEQPSSEEKKDDKPAATEKTSAPAEKPAADGKAAAVDKPDAAKDTAPETKTIDAAQKKTVSASPAAMAALDALSTPAPTGTGGLFKAIVIGALAIIVIMLLITKLNADKQYKTLIEHLQYIEKNLVK